MTAEVAYELGVTLVGRGQIPEAIELLEKAVEIDADHGPACKLLAKLCLQINERRAFVNWCHEASRIDPDDPEPYEMMADELERAGRKGEAAEARAAAAKRRSSQAR